MKTIPENKVELYLKLGKTLACFVKVDSYFESKTFDWIKLEKTDVNYKATLIRSFDERDTTFNDILQFETVNDLDESENSSVQGPMEVIKDWVSENFNKNMNGFH